MEESYWNTDYWHSMDRSKGKEDIININPQQIGISHGIGDPLQGLRGNIFVGASKVELGFMGQGKGFRGQPTSWTPESVSKSEREAIRQLSKINEVELSTHATPNVAISGIGEQGFSAERKEQALTEVKKAIEFAADTAEGGPVVLHAQEFPRSIVEYYEKEKFMQYPDEKEKAIIPLVDERTGQVVSLRRDIEIPLPQKEIRDEKGRIIDFERDSEGKIKMKTGTFADFEKEFNKLPEDVQKKYNNNVGKYFYEQFQRRQIEAQEADAQFYDQRAKEIEKAINVLNQVKESYEKKLKEGREQEAKDNLILNLKDRGLMPPPENPKEFNKFIENPEKFLSNRLDESVREIERWREGALASSKQAHQIKRELERIKPIEEYGVKQSADAIARAAMYGFEVEEKRGLKRPITIVPENWTPEIYGSHPQELKKLVQESRSAMEDKLVKQKNIDRDKAKEIAKERIKATFDIGHLNMWRKYFDGTDKEFKKWVDSQVKDLLKSGIIGHVHLTDNFGYHDEHLTPGEGTAPIKEFLQRLETEGYKGTIIGEPGGQPEGQIFKAMTGSWGLSDYPIYRINMQASAWSDIENSYFGRTTSPSFVVGDFAPSKEWSFWSEVPLE